MEAEGQDVDQKASDEFFCRQAHLRHAIRALDALVFPTECDSVGNDADGAMVGDRDSVRVPAQTGQHLIRPTERRFGLSDPNGFAQWCEIGGEGIRFCQSHQIDPAPGITDRLGHL